MTLPEPTAPAAPAWRFALLVTIGVGVVGAIASARVPSGAVWASLTPADCAEYCEASHRCGPLATRAAVQQPLNAWSNLGYVFVGALAWRRPLRPLAALFSASCAVLAIGSFAFHASVTREMQWLDMAGTYAALVAVAARGIAAAWQLAEGIALAAALAADAILALFKWAISSSVALPLLIAVAVVPMRRLVRLGRQSARAALVPLALIGAAVLFRQLDVAHVACHPDGAFQGHALWHVLTAASLGTSFFFFENARA